MWFMLGFRLIASYEDPVNWANDRANRWAASHPHTYGDWFKGKRNVIFVAKPELEFISKNGVRRLGVPGAGSFPRYHNRLRLSDPNERLVSRWRLPALLKPRPEQGKMISSIGNGDWTAGTDSRFVHLNPGKTTLWQEAVVQGNPHAAQWAIGLIRSLGCST
jgi:hypothetical protein